MPGTIEVSASFGLGNTITLQMPYNSTVAQLKAQPRVQALGLPANVVARLDGSQVPDTTTLTEGDDVAFEAAASSKA
jgi:hypothetical protein